MRIRNITITEWRNFQNVILEVEQDARVVCLVGANGTGKTQLLELIAACAHRLGLSPGVDIPRGDPFDDAFHDFSLTFYLSGDVRLPVDGLEIIEEEAFRAWDRTLTIASNLEFGERILAGGIPEQDEAQRFAGLVVAELRKAEDVHFLSLDSDRSYPKKVVSTHQAVEAYQIDWRGAEYTRGRSFVPTTTLYDEWIKYFLAQENKVATGFLQDTRRANKAGAAQPEFVDYAENYTRSLQEVLPHLTFVGVDSFRRTLLFDTTGTELTFDRLSGGEREIAFLVGQIDRFGLRQGLLLLDEPELHLNTDLIRTWINYLAGTVSTGQIWLATHSLEAVEATGRESTFVLERREDSRTVKNAARLDTRPVRSALSRALGTPAFSISQLRFSCVEGEESLDERERYRKLAGPMNDVRFMESGSCTEVIRRVATIKALENEAEGGIRIGGIVDRDFRSDVEADTLRAETGVFVLPVHEVENFFLHPATLDTVLEQNGRQEKGAVDLIQAAADARAGSWVFQWTMATPNAGALPDLPATAKALAKAMTWDVLRADGNSLQAVLDASGFSDEHLVRFRRILKVGIKLYERKRSEEDLWKICEGKQVLNDVARSTGLAESAALIQTCVVVWNRVDAIIPDELVQFRDYLVTL